MMQSSQTNKRCDGCLGEILEPGSSIVCSHADCKKLFHCDALCVGNKPRNEDMSTWVCPQCKCEGKRGGDNSSTPVRGSGPVQPAAASNITLRQKKPTSDVQALTLEIRSLREDMLSFKKHMEVITGSISVINDQLVQIVARFDITDERITVLENRLESETISLRKQVSSLQEQLNIQAQAHVRNEIEIVGLPETTNENLYHITMVAAKKLGVDLKDSDIDWVARAGPRRNNPISAGSRPDSSSQLSRPVVVRLVRRFMRNELLKSAKGRKPLTAIDLQVSDKASNIYFNERLTRDNRNLFRETRIRATQAGYKFCWTNNGFINVRKQEGSPAIRIRNTAELAERFGEEQNPCQYGGPYARHH